MDKKKLLMHVRGALEDITRPELYADERGYHGEFYAILRARVEADLPKGLHLRMEPQKSESMHGLRLRPDIILHEPFDVAIHEDRNQGNDVVFELKRRASKREALRDFESLYSMIRCLDYEAGIFINIDAARSFAEHLPAVLKGRVTCFAVRLENGRPIVIEES
jgi:hypothetical protein